MTDQPLETLKEAITEAAKSDPFDFGRYLNSVQNYTIVLMNEAHEKEIARLRDMSVEQLQEEYETAKNRTLILENSDSIGMSTEIAESNRYKSMVFNILKEKTK